MRPTQWFLFLALAIVFSVGKSDVFTDNMQKLIDSGADEKAHALLLKRLEIELKKPASSCAYTQKIVELIQKKYLKKKEIKENDFKVFFEETGKEFLACHLDEKFHQRVVYLRAFLEGKSFDEFIDFISKNFNSMNFAVQSALCQTVAGRINWNSKTLSLRPLFLGEFEKKIIKEDNQGSRSKHALALIRALGEQGPQQK